MKRYEIIAHVADIRLSVEGSTMPELFNAALEGMAEIITPQQCTPPFNKQIELSVASVDATTLLIDFLSDVLTQTHLTKALYCKAEFTELSEKKLQAKLYGNMVKSFDEDIKAVTYHEADVKKNGRGNFQTIIIFDI